MTATANLQAAAHVGQPPAFGRVAFAQQVLHRLADGMGTLPAAMARESLLQDVEHFGLVLHDLAQRIEEADPSVDAALRSLMARLQAHSDPRCVGLYVFAAALAKRLAGTASDEANLYLQGFEVPQIELFNLLGRSVPFARLATQIANDAIAGVVVGQTNPTVIDVGIGTGRQVLVLMETLAERGQLPASLTVVGIEPSGWALEQARTQLLHAAERLGTALTFMAIESSAEDMLAVQWQAIAQACQSRPVINASFALHHVADDAAGHDQRNAVLCRLHALNPQLLVLTEPDVDHLQTRFYQRFRNCFAHFGAMFATLDALPLAQADRDALKVGFFGREINDILAAPEGQRSERHECAASWFQRLVATGFVAVKPASLPASPHPAVNVLQRGQRVALQAGTEPVVSIFLAAPQATAAV